MRPTRSKGCVDGVFLRPNEVDICIVCLLLFIHGIVGESRVNSSIFLMLQFVMVHTHTHGAALGDSLLIVQAVHFRDAFQCFLDNYFVSEAQSFSETKEKDIYYVLRHNPTYWVVGGQRD